MRPALEAWAALITRHQVAPPVGAAGQTFATGKVPMEFFAQARIGRTPLYMQFQGSASYLDIFRPGSIEGTYGRIDAFPQLTLPIRSGTCVTPCACSRCASPR